MRLTQEQVKQIYDDAREQLHQADPLPIYCMNKIEIKILKVDSRGDIYK